MQLADSLIKEGWLETPAIINAFRKIKREDFMPSDMKDMAELNEALPIGFGQTISQPLTVAFMLEKLQPGAGDKILDVGSGSGWTTALLSEIVGPKSLPAGRQGKVIAIETVPELKEFGKNNAEKYNFVKSGIAEFILGDGSKGFEREAPYDKILVSAAGRDLPAPLKKQLKIGGRMVIPIGNSIWLFIKTGDAKLEEYEYPGFAFVPLIEK